MLDHTERRDHAPTGTGPGPGPNVYEALGLSPRLRVSFRPASPSPSAIRVSIDAPQHVDTAPLRRRSMEA